MSKEPQNIIGEDLEDNEDRPPPLEEVQETELCQAIINKDNKEFRRIIFSGANINQKSGLQQLSPLYLAAQRGQSSMIMILLAFGADIEEDIEGLTPLAAAYLEGHKESAKILLAAGANAECEINGQKLISIASQNGDHELLKLISNINPTHETNKTHNLIPILFFSKINDFEVVKHLIKVYGDEIVKSSGPGNITALHYCAIHKDIKLALLLISKGAPINSLTNQNESPMHWAAMMGNLFLVQILMRKNADIEIKSNADKTPFMNSCENGHKDVAKFLVENGANTDYQSPIKGNALHIAAKMGNVEILDLFVERKPEFDIMQKDPNGETALEIAAHYGRTMFLNKMIDVLQDKGLLKRTIEELKKIKVNCTCYSIGVLKEKEEKVIKGKFEIIVSGLSFKNYERRYRTTKEDYISPTTQNFNDIVLIRPVHELEPWIKNKFIEKEKETLTQDEMSGKGLKTGEVMYYRLYLDPPSISIDPNINPGLVDTSTLPTRVPSTESATQLKKEDQRAAGSDNDGR